MAVIDRSKFPTADDEYTPEQRRVIDARLAEARKGPYHGPFATADEAIGFLNKEMEVRSGKRKKPSSKAKFQAMRVVLADRAIPAVMDDCDPCTDLPRRTPTTPK